MEDAQIVRLYWMRSEDAISETARKYGPYCRTIAYNILQNEEDSEECVSDTYWRAWNAMPDQRPARLAAFLGKITRNLALNRWEGARAEKRGAGQVPLLLDELRECTGQNPAEQLVDELAFAERMNRFLGALPPEKRKIFMRRYWYCSSIREISADFALSESKVKMVLLRTRRALKTFLEQEGIGV